VYQTHSPSEREPASVSVPTIVVEFLSPFAWGGFQMTFRKLQMPSSPLRKPAGYGWASTLCLALNPRIVLARILNVRPIVRSVTLLVASNGSLPTFCHVWANSLGAVGGELIITNGRRANGRRPWANQRDGRGNPIASGLVSPFRNSATWLYGSSATTSTSIRSSGCTSREI